MKKWLGIALAAVVAGIGAQYAFGANIACVDGSQSCDGTNNPDVIIGSTGDDTINARGGNDQIDPSAGDDTLRAGAGNDDSDGGVSGEDVLLMGEGADFADEVGDFSRNRFNGGPGNDCMGGGEKADNINGAGGNDRGGHDACGDGPVRLGLFGFSGKDRIRGGAGRDGLFGGPDADILIGGKGGDLLEAKFGGTQGADILRCGGGFDRYSASRNDLVADSCERRIQLTLGPRTARGF